MCDIEEDSDSNGGFTPTENKVPIIYSSNYGIQFCGIEKLHPFDVCKGKRIMQYLKAANFINGDNFHKPREITKRDLLQVHTKRYIQSLKWSVNIAKITEIPLLFFVPNGFLQRAYLKPMRFQANGSILAAKMALRDGWAINLGGGFHHCCANAGGGFCSYADITLLITVIRKEYLSIANVMIIDLDAHQGNGHERDFINRSDVYILDIYNAYIYPRDHEAKLAIKCAVELKPKTKDCLYLKMLKRSLEKAFKEFKPNLIVYNAGTDVLENDPLGLLSITPSGVVERDEIVFSLARAKQIPIVMLLSGGYLPISSKVIADSILNLNSKGLISAKI